MAFQYWALAKLCGVEQRAPLIFGRAAITLGIGRHSSLNYFNLQYTVVVLKFITVALRLNDERMRRYIYR